MRKDSASKRPKKRKQKTIAYNSHPTVPPPLFCMRRSVKVSQSLRKTSFPSPHEIIVAGCPSKKGAAFAPEAARIASLGVRNHFKFECEPYTCQKLHLAGRCLYEHGLVVQIAGAQAAFCVRLLTRFLIVDQFRYESERDCFICVPVKIANALTKESLSFDFLMAVGEEGKK